MDRYPIQRKRILPWPKRFSVSSDIDFLALELPGAIRAEPLIVSGDGEEP